MKNLTLQITLDQYQNEEELTEVDRKLLNQARLATYKSYAPYSNFHVGAAILLDDGTIVSGNNQENAAFPSGLCAERSAIFWTGANYPEKKIKSIAVVARPGGSDLFRGVSPCGACRQSILEYETRQKSPIRLILVGSDHSILITHSIGDLLPLKFEEF